MFQNITSKFRIHWFTLIYLDKFLDNIPLIIEQLRKLNVGLLIRYHPWALVDMELKVWNKTKTWKTHC